MITGWSLFFIVVGVASVSAQFMRFILWLDTPKGGKHGRY